MKGTGVAPRYEYGVESESGTQRLYTKTIPLDGSDSDTGEWTKTYTDMLGRTYKTVYADGTASVQTYNNKGQLTAQSDPDGVTTLYQYNGKGELEFTALDAGTTNGTIDFTGSDRITQTVSDVVNDAALGNVRRSRTYVLPTAGSAASNLVSTVLASTDGLQSWSIAWNGSASVTNRSVTAYIPASGLRIVTATAPDGSTTVTTNQNGRVIAVTRRDSSNNQLSSLNVGYDSHGRPNSVTDARNGTATFGFNSADQVSGMLTPAPGAGQSAQLTTNFFDALGRVWKTTLADGSSVTNAFALTGAPQLTSGARTYPSGSGYDAQGRFKSLTNWSSFPSAGARATTWNYDSQRGWLTGKSYPDGTGPSYGYTAAGRLKTRTWARGTNVTYTYSGAGDLITAAYTDGSASVSSGFDRLGRPTAVTNGANVCSYAFNDLGLLLGESCSGGVLNGLVLSNKFDAFLRRTNLSINNQLSTINSAYGYDSASRLATVSNGTNSATYAYLANSPLIDSVVFKQNTTVRLTRTNQFDLLNRLTNLVWSAGATTVASFAYQYNDANQRTRATLADGSYWIYQYDFLGQVTGAKKYWSDGTPVAGQQTTFGFDDIGNRTTAASGGDSSGGGLRSAAYGANLLNQYTNRTVPGYVDMLGEATNTATVTINNQATYRRGDYFRRELLVTNTAPLWLGITNLAVLNNGTNADIIATNLGNVFLPATPEAFSYDRDGNLTNDGRWQLTWDAENRATSFTRISGASSGAKVKVDCAYDYRWRRTQKIVSTWNGSTYVAQSTNKFVYDGWNLVAMLDGTNGLVCSFTWGSDASGTLQGAGGVGGLISMTVHQGTNAGTYFYCFDGNHNVAALINAANGAVAGRWECDAFGNVLRATGALAFVNPFVFSTKFCDWETGFYYYGYRYYDPSAGRWLGRDLLGEVAGFNLYAAFLGNPVSVVDRNGLDNWGNPSAGQNSVNQIIFSPYTNPSTGDSSSAYGLGSGWLTGNSATTRSFSGNDPIAQEMRASPEAEVARNELRSRLNTAGGCKPGISAQFRRNLGDESKAEFYAGFWLDVFGRNPSRAFMGSFSGTAKVVDCYGCCAVVEFSMNNTVGWKSGTRFPPPYGYDPTRPALFQNPGVFNYFTSYYSQYLFVNAFNPSGAHPFDPHYIPSSVLPDYFFGQYGQNINVHVTWKEMICPANGALSPTRRY